MTEITTDRANTTRTIPVLDTSDILLTLIVSLLAPMFLGVTAGDADMARMAALETVNAYRGRNHADLVAVAQIIGFGLAALGSLSLSMEDATCIPMTLRLRGNAVACNRAAEQNRRTLAKSQACDPVARPAQPDFAKTTPVEPDQEPEIDVFLSAIAAEQIYAESQARLQPATGAAAVPCPAPNAAIPRGPREKRSQEMWAIAMVKESSEFSAGILNLPPAEREAATIRAGMLSSTAHNLIHGISAGPLPAAALAGTYAGRKPPPRP